MAKLFAKLISILAIAAMICGYNAVLALRSNAEEIARLEYELALANAQIEAAQEELEEADYIYEDGIYSGTAFGYAGDISVEVRMEKDRMTEIKVVSAPEEDAIYLMLAQSVIDAILREQSTDVDAISGATFSSTGIIHAVADALE